MRSNRTCYSFIMCMVVILFVALAQQVYGSEKKSSEVDTKSKLTEDKGGDQNRGEANENFIIVYYFHGKVRCQTCRKIEQLTTEAVKESFGSEIKKGTVELKVINVEEEGNTHFTQDYQLFTRSVVISHMVNGKERQWKNLQRVWELVHDEKAFKAYIRDEMSAYLS